MYCCIWSLFEPFEVGFIIQKSPSPLSSILPHLKKKNKHKTKTPWKIKNCSTHTCQIAFPTSYCYFSVSKVQPTFCDMQGYNQSITQSVSFWCVTNHPKLYWLKATIIYLCIILWVSNLGWAQLDWSSLRLTHEAALTGKSAGGWLLYNGFI